MYCTSETINCSTNTLGSNYTYSWSTTIPGAVFSQQGLPTTEITVSSVPNVGTAYFIYVTVYDQNWAIVTIEQSSIAVYNCCTTSNNVTIVKNASTSSMPAWNTAEVVIVGTLTVDNTFTVPFAVKEITILRPSPMSNSGITVLANSNFNATNGPLTIKGCNYLWDMIFVKSGGSITLDQTIVKNAYRAIYINGNPINPVPTITASGCHFNDNAIGMDITNLSPTIALENNTFEMEAQVLLPNLSSHNALSAIDIKNVPGISFNNSGTNQVIYLSGGIRILNSNVSIGADAFSFEHIQPFGTGDYEGTAIFTQNTTGSTYLLEKTGANNPNIWDIDDCFNGIWSMDVDLTVTDNHIRSTKSGILFSNDLTNKNILEFENNTIEASQYGIFLHEINRVKENNIYNNTITIDGSIQNRGSAGIKIVETGNDVPHSSTIKSNSIILERAAFGIDLLCTVENTIEENTIQMTEPDWNQAGIALTKSIENTIICNYIYGSGASQGSTNNLNPFGIRATSSPNCYYSFNSVFDTYTGIAFEETCDNSDINHNNFHAHTFGLHYNNQATTGPQSMKGNKWYTQCLSYNAFHGGLAGADYFEFGLGCNPCNPLPYVYPLNPSWFIQLQINEVSIESPCSNPEMAFSLPTDSLVSQFDYSVVNNELDYGVFDTEMDWINSRLVYNKLIENPNLVNSNLLFEEFVDSIQQTTAGAYQELKIDENQALTISIVSQQYLDGLKLQQKILLDSIAHLALLISSELNQQVLGNYLFLKSQLLIQIEVIEQQYLTALTGYKSIRNSQLSTLMSENQAIVNSAVFEENESIINEFLYTSLLNGKVALSSQQKEILRGIAIQCPISGGPAVYTARSLYSRFADTLYLDKQICLEAGIIKSAFAKSDGEFEFVITPNPTSGLIQITWKKLIDETGHVKIFNHVGQMVLEKQISLSLGICTIDLKQLSAGSYFCTIGDAKNSKLNAQRFVVIR
jgi:hypothetical protein